MKIAFKTSLVILIVAMLTASFSFSIVHYFKYQNTLSDGTYYTQSDLDSSFQDGVDSTTEEHTNEVTNLNAEITALTNQNNNYKNQVSTLNADKSNLQTQVDNLTATNSASEETIDNLNAQINSLNTQITNLNNKIAENESKISELEQTVANSSSQENTGIYGFWFAYSESDSSYLQLQLNQDLTLNFNLYGADCTVVPFSGSYTFKDNTIVSDCCGTFTYNLQSNTIFWEDVSNVLMSKQKDIPAMNDILGTWDLGAMQVEILDDGYFYGDGSPIGPWSIDGRNVILTFGDEGSLSCQYLGDNVMYFDLFGEKGIMTRVTNE